MPAKVYEYGSYHAMVADIPERIAKGATCMFVHKEGENWQIIIIEHPGDVPGKMYEWDSHHAMVADISERIAKGATSMFIIEEGGTWKLTIPDSAKETGNVGKA